MDLTKKESAGAQAPAPKARNWPWLVALLVLFAAALVFVIPSFSKYHGDERFYTDAALRMSQTGDYWTPYYANGKLRLLKPIVTYWAIAASFKSFGVNLAASRVPSLAAGLISLWMTFLLGRNMFRSSWTGLFAAAMLASNIEFLTLSGRATPDGLVTLFGLVSMTGFALAWFGADDRKSLMPALLAWGGMGLAVQTKGLLGLCPLVAMIIFILLTRPAGLRQPLMRLADWRAILVGLFLALFWYVVMARLHGTSAFRDFVDDQVTAKVTFNPGVVLTNFFTYSTAGLRHFLPWTFLLLLAAIFSRQQLRSLWNAHRSRFIFLLILFPLLILAFSFGNMRTSRYVMLSYPMLAVLLAGLLESSVKETAWLKNLNIVSKGIGIVLVLAGACFVLFGASVGWRMTVGGAFMCAIGISGWFNHRLNPGERQWLYLSLLMICLFAVFDGSIRPLSTPTPFESIVRQVREKAADTGPMALSTYRVDETVASELRLASRGTVSVRQLQKADLENPPALLLTTAEGMGVPSLRIYSFWPVAMDSKTLALRDALRKYRRTAEGRNTGGRNTDYFLGTYQPSLLKAEPAPQ